LLLLGGITAAVLAWLGVAAITTIAVHVTQAAAIFAFFHLLAEAACREVRRGWQAGSPTRRRSRRN
jgi:hypothetical protein